MPNVAQLSFPVPEPARIRGPKLEALVSDGLKGDGNSSFSQEIFKASETEGESVVHPDGMTDDRCQKSVAGVAQVVSHPVIPPN